MIPAALPDPAEPTFVLLMGAFGAFLGASLGRALGRNRAELRALTENWAYAWTASALAVYVMLLVLELLT